MADVPFWFEPDTSQTQHDILSLDPPVRWELYWFWSIEHHIFAANVRTVNIGWSERTGVKLVIIEHTCWTWVLVNICAEPGYHWTYVLNLGIIEHTCWTWVLVNICAEPDYHWTYVLNLVIIEHICWTWLLLNIVLKVFFIEHTCWNWLLLSIYVEIGYHWICVLKLVINEHV
jgi:hypothetical protein